MCKENTIAIDYHVTNLVQCLTMGCILLTCFLFLQASKLGLLKNKSIVCFFASYQVVHFSFLPLVVSIIATSQANTGLLLGLEKEIEETAKKIKVVVDGV